MDLDKMQLLLEKVVPNLAHHSTHQAPVDPGERLAVTIK
jgi:hypothetical protein